MAHGELELVEAVEADEDTEAEWRRERRSALERDAWRLADSLWAHHCPGRVADVSILAATVRVQGLTVTITTTTVHIARHDAEIATVRRGLPLGELVERIAALAA